MSGSSSRRDHPVVLLHVFPSFVPAGAELRTIGLIEALGSDFEHQILSMDGKTSAVDRISKAATVKMLMSPPSGGSPRTVLRVRRLLQQEKPDLVLTHNWGTIDVALAAISLGYPVIHHEDGFNADEADRLKARRNVARRVLLRFAFRTVVPSRSLYSIATERWKLSPQGIELIPNGIVAERFSGSATNHELRRELGIPLDAGVVGSVGHFRRIKRFERLVELLDHPDPPMDVHLLLVGDGAERPALESRVEQLGITDRVHMVGQKEDVSPYLQAMDVFALSSDSEQLPVSLLEAMASSLPVVSTDVGDVRATLPSEQGDHLVSLDGEDVTRGLQESVFKLMMDPRMRADLGSANRDRVEEEYSFDRMKARHETLYHLALDAPP